MDHLIGPIAIASASLAGVIILATIGLATLIVSGHRAIRRDLTDRLDRHQVEAAADRRTFQASMDTYRADMLRLAERQSNLEGRFQGPATSAAD